MQRAEIINTRYGEMLDMISALSIYDGRASAAEKKKTLSFDEIMKLR